jgi:hypothetical protein
VPLVRDRARPSHTVWVRPAATWVHGSRPRRARPTASAGPRNARCTAARHGGGVARRANGGMAPVHRRRPRNGRLTGAGTTVRRNVDGRAAGGTVSAASDRGGRDDSVRGEAVKAAARCSVRRRARGARRRRHARGCRALSGRGSGLKARVSGVAHGSHAAMARCRAGPAQRVASDRWGPPVSDFRI